ncbi:hypothetical protein D9619_011880 [Psilocybe cf. subviscida]|uniref:Uncharacterized protein n=1 Tax=Psilocybe cf. subviscida TaxID=2480587 RepID=A0A8H5B031_9AGAR|nr:hypothetical protein D9619_011880 [Psilocybe cf. subviscida]
MRRLIFSRRSIQARAESALASILLTRYTVLFFVVSLLYCSAEGIVQSLLFRVDVEYSTLTNGIVSGGNIPAKNITWRVGNSYDPSNPIILRMCNDIPHGQTPDPCIVIFNATRDSPFGRDFQPSNLTKTRTLPDWGQGMNVTRVPNAANASLVDSVMLAPAGGGTVVLSEECVQTLVYPAQYLQNLRREDITWIVLQFWLLAISVLAVVYGSVPHVLAVLMTRLISSAWAAYAVWRGPTIATYLREMISDAGTPCSLELYDAFFQRRGALAYADLVLSTTGLAFFSFLSLTLLRTYSAQSFKVVGAPEHIMHINKFFMALLACLQLEVFPLAAGMGLWINVLLTSSILHISEHTNLYEALYISTVIIILPWIATGWHAIRHEKKRLMLGFLAIGFIIISGWAVLFYSIVFRWVFVQWPYLGCWTVASFILLFATMILGVVCRMNFGKGLKEYLHAESTLASLNFAPDAFDVRPSSDGASQRTSSVRKSKEAGLDFKDSDFSDLDLNGPPMFFIASLDNATPPSPDARTVLPGVMSTGGDLEKAISPVTPAFPKLVAVRRANSSSSTASSSSSYSVRRVPVPQIVITGASTTSSSPTSESSFGEPLVSSLSGPRSLYDPRTGAVASAEKQKLRSPFADSSDDDMSDSDESVRAIVSAYGSNSSGSGGSPVPASTSTLNTKTTTATSTSGSRVQDSTGGASGYVTDVSSSESYYSRSTSSPSSTDSESLSAQQRARSPVVPPLRWAVPPQSPAPSGPLPPVRIGGAGSGVAVRPPRPSDAEENFEGL